MQVLLFSKDGGWVEGSVDSQAVNWTEGIWLALVVEAMTEGHTLSEVVPGDRVVCVGTEAQDIRNVGGMKCKDCEDVVLGVLPAGVVVSAFGLLVVAEGRAACCVGEVDGMAEESVVVEVDGCEELAGGSGEALVEGVFTDAGVHADHDERWLGRRESRRCQRACRDSRVLGSLMQFATLALRERRKDW